MSIDQCHFIYHVFECFGFIPEFTNPSVVELSVLRSVAGCLWSNAIKAGRMTIAVFLLLKVPHISDSAAEGTTFRIFSLRMYGAVSLWIGFYWTERGLATQLKLTCITAY